MIVGLVGDEVAPQFGNPNSMVKTPAAYSCNVYVDANATPGIRHLDCTGAVTADYRGIPIRTTCRSGTVSVNVPRAP